MKLELQCRRCDCRFDARSSRVHLDQLVEEGPWMVLGDGETFEDRLHATLTAECAIRCPECAAPVSISEDCLGRLALEVLAQW